MTNTSGPGTPPPPPVWEATPAAGAPKGYGGFWLRLIAYIIDALVIGIPTGILGMLAGQSMMTTGDPGVGMGSNVVSLIVAWLYFAFMESSARGATLGKRAVGLRVVTDQGGQLSFANASGRYFAKFVSAILLMVGFLMVAFTDRKRGLHDMMAGTLVVKV